jgi:hypothetical protein
MFTFLRYLSVSLILLVSPLAAQDAGNGAKPEKLFESVETMEISMTAPWHELLQDKNFTGSYPANLAYTDEAGNEVSIDLTVERRGVTRQRVCRIPPIKLRFVKGAAKDTIFRGQKSLKMVTHCQKDSDYQQYYVLEMLAYRIYNLLTDYSFRVRPLTVMYFQADAEEHSSRFSFFKKETSAGPVFAFLIEDDKDVANRFDLDKVNIPRIKPEQLDTTESALLGLFQYMIANVDWAATMGPQPDECCHNVKLIGPEPTSPDDILHALPYDFDSSGLVDASYATPNEGLPIRRVTQRLYRGYCASNPGLQDARQRMLDKEQSIYGLVKAESRLEADRQEKALEFLQGFYEVIKDDEKFRREIVEECRG